MREWLKKRPRRRKFICYWLPSLFVAWMLFGFFGVPLIVRKWIVPKIGERLDGSITLKDCTFNPFTWRMVLDGLDINDKAGQRTLGAARIDANAELWRTLFQTGWHMTELKVDDPYIRAELMADGVPNYWKLLKPTPPRDPSLPPEEPLKKIPRIVIDICTVANGRLQLTDQTTTPPVKLDWAGMDFSVDQIDTRPEHNNPHTLTMSTDTGEKLSWTGTFFVNPLSSAGTLKVEKLDITRFQPYVDRFADAKVVSGNVTVELAYHFSPVLAQREANVAVTSFTLESLRVDQGGLHAVDLPLVRVSDLVGDADARTLTVGSVQVEGGSIAVERDKQGVLSLARLLKPLPASAAPGSAATVPPRVDPATIKYPLVQLITATQNLIEDAQRPWTVELKSLTTKSVKAVWTDGAARSPVELAATNVALGIGPVRSAERYRTPLTLAVDLLTGHATVSGTLEPLGTEAAAAPRAQLQIESTSLALAALAPYLPQQPASQLPAADLRSGSLSAKGTLTADLGTPLHAHWQGDTTIASLGFDGNGSSPNRVLGAATITTSGETDVLFTVATGAAALTHTGKLGLAGVEAKPTLVGPSQVRWADLTIDGASSIGTDAGLTVKHTGPINLREFVATGPIAKEGESAGQPSTLRLSDATVEGSMELLVPTSGPLAATHEGSVRTGSIAVQGPLAGPIDATLASVQLTGKAGLRGESLTADGQATVTSARLEAAELAGPVSATLDQLSIAGKIASSGAAKPGEPLPPTAGTLDIVFGKLRAEAPKAARSSLSWDAFRLDALALDTAAKTIVTKSATLTNPSTALSASLIPRADGAPLPEGTLTAADLRFIKPLLNRLANYSVAAETVRVDGGTMHVKDPTATPPIDVMIEAVEAQATGFSTDMSRPLAVHFACRVAGSGKVGADAQVDLSGTDAKATGTITLTAVPVVPFSAGPGHFLGYQATDGRISTTIPVTLANDTMKGNLKLLLDRFTLGEATNSPAAPSVPVKFGLALLKDKNDQIDIEIPFEGKITDPGFSVGGLIWKVIINLLVKAATAPFTLIGSLFGGGDTDLSAIIFEPGSAELSPKALSTLDKLTKALTERPGLNIAVAGTVIEESDTAALKNQMLRQAFAKRAGLENPALLTPDELKKQTILAHRGLPQDQQAPPPPGAEEASVEEMTAALLARAAVTPEDLENLRTARAQAVVDFFVKEKQIPASRAKIGEPKAPADKAAEPAKEPRAVFELF